MTRRTAFQDGGRQLGLEYRPELFADPDFVALVERVRVTNDWRLSARALARILVAWTLTARRRPIPITEEAILELPRPLHVAIVRAIAADRARLRRAGAPPVRRQGRG